MCIKENYRQKKYRLRGGDRLKGKGDKRKTEKKPTEEEGACFFREPSGESYRNEKRGVEDRERGLKSQSDATESTHTLFYREAVDN